MIYLLYKDGYVASIYFRERERKGEGGRERERERERKGREGGRVSRREKEKERANLTCSSSTSHRSCEQPHRGRWDHTACRDADKVCSGSGC